MEKSGFRKIQTSLSSNQKKSQKEKEKVIAHRRKIQKLGLDTRTGKPILSYPSFMCSMGKQMFSEYPSDCIGGVLLYEMVSFWCSEHPTSSLCVLRDFHSHQQTMLGQ